LLSAARLVRDGRAAVAGPDTVLLYFSVSDHDPGHGGAEDWSRESVLTLQELQSPMCVFVCVSPGPAVLPALAMIWNRDSRCERKTLIPAR
jgi:hypothetical protein